MKITLKSIGSALLFLGIVTVSDNAFGQSGTGGRTTTSGSTTGGSSSSGSTTSSFGGQTSSLSGSTSSGFGSGSSSGSGSGSTNTNSSTGRTTGTTGGTGGGGTGGTQTFVGGNGSQTFVGGGRQSTGNSVTGNRQFQGITDNRQVPGSNGQQTGTPRRVSAPIRIGFDFPSPSASPGMASSNAPSLDRFFGANPELSEISVAVSPQGIAILTGAARSTETRRLAANLIRLQPGVRKVENQIEVAE
ncbi:MAG: BON domain-containing protein [Planctomyces sp.]|nr:BON domain-containing protein [Planctomyces sp.]